VVDTNEVRSAFDVLMQCRMLPMLLESFVGASLFNGTIAVPESPTQSPEDMRRNQYLITNDVERYMAEYEVRYAPPFFTRQQELRLPYYRPAGTPT
jgi:anaphase-promoting complex subunit 2